jgi:hypothetical protein
MKATIAAGRDKFSIFHRREKTANFEEHVIINPVTCCAAVTARIYWGRTRCYCCVWVHGDNYRQGSGYVDGGGYHMASAAVAVALANAGVTLSESIEGVGETAIRDALLATAEALGVESPIYHHSHA